MTLSADWSLRLTSPGSNLSSNIKSNLRCYVNILTIFLESDLATIAIYVKSWNRRAMVFKICSGRNIILPSLAISCFFKEKAALKLLKYCLQCKIPLGMHDLVV